MRKTDSKFEPIPDMPGCTHNPELADQLLGPLDPTLKAALDAYRKSLGIWKSLYHKAADERDALAKRVRELEGEMKYRHEHCEPCPITGNPIPNEYMWSNHDRPGVFNECGACTEDEDAPMSCAEALERLNAKRELEDGDAERT